MKGPKDLLANEDHWTTRMGLVFPGERVVFRGKDLFNELKDMRWMELWLFGITGRRFNKEQILLFEGMWTLCTSYPDPRIWNNRISSLAGTSRSSCTLGLSAAISVSEATIYGRGPDIRAIDFLLRTKKKIDAGESIPDILNAEIKRYRGIAGFARPIVSSDERILPLLNHASKLGLGNGYFVSLSFEIERALTELRYRMKMNIAMLGAALAADQGLNALEYYRFLIPAFIGGMFPCFLEAQEKSEGTFFPMSCSRILYEGKEKRSWN
jgi:hypothetical protein